MKSALLVVILGLFLISGCQDGVIMPGLSSGYMSADINGTPFETTSVVAARVPATPGYADGITITGTSNSGFPQIVINLNSKSKGTYNLGVVGTGSTTATYSTSDSEQNVSVSGSLNITMVEYTQSGVIKGTFEFETTGDSITNGTFEASFTN